jgi:hypothetical protein
VNKYNAKKTIYNGITFDSKKEAEFAMYLDSEQQAGRIHGYNRQVPFEAIINGKKCFKYILDFEVLNKDDTISHIDIKGMRKGQAYAMFRIKKKIIDALFNINIEAV